MRDAEPVRRALSAYRFRGASSYSRLEFKRAWLQRAALLHRWCRLPDVSSPGDVLRLINKRLANHPAQKRRLQVCLDLMICFLNLKHPSLSPRVQLARLRAHCKHVVLGGAIALDEMVTGYFDGTGCSRAKELPTENPDGSLDVTIRNCNPSRIHCNVHSFFQRYRTLFIEIADQIQNTPTASDELVQIACHIRKAQEQSLHLCDNRHCAKLADALIAVDGKDMDEFAANNDREWVLLARALRKTLINPVVDKRYTYVESS